MGKEKKKKEAIRRWILRYTITVVSIYRSCSLEAGREKGKKILKKKKKKRGEGPYKLQPKDHHVLCTGTCSGSQKKKKGEKKHKKKKRESISQSNFLSDEMQPERRGKNSRKKGVECRECQLYGMNCY